MRSLLTIFFVLPLLLFAEAVELIHEQLPVGFGENLRFIEKIEDMTVTLNDSSVFSLREAAPLWQTGDLIGVYPVNDGVLLENRIKAVQQPVPADLIMPTEKVRTLVFLDGPFIQVGDTIWEVLKDDLDALQSFATGMDVILELGPRQYFRKEDKVHVFSTVIMMNPNLTQWIYLKSPSGISQESGIPFKIPLSLEKEQLLTRRGFYYPQVKRWYFTNWLALYIPEDGEEILSATSEVVRLSLTNEKDKLLIEPEGTEKPSYIGYIARPPSSPGSVMVAQDGARIKMKNGTQFTVRDATQVADWKLKDYLIFNRNTEPKEVNGIFFEVEKLEIINLNRLSFAYEL